jgi:multiple sugar transport system substrate-binding protein
MRRASLAATVFVLSGALALAGCSGDAGGGTADGGEAGASDEPVVLRYSLWGSDARVQNTQEIIRLFEEEHPDISVEIEFLEFSGYWDRLNTQIASDDVPDIMLMDIWNLGQYAERDLLLDLSSVDLSDIPDEIVASGTVDGEYVGLAQGVNAPAIVANPRLFREAGLELPDDETWTWQDLEEIAATIGERLEGVHGIAGPDSPRLFQAWLRQNDAFFMDSDGNIGFDAEDAAGYLEWLDGLRRAGAFPDAATMVADAGAGQDQSLLATGKAAMDFGLTNLLGALSAAAGEELVLLRYPSTTGDAADAQMWYNTLIVSASADTEHPDEVAEFLDFSINDERAVKQNLSDRGVPANAAVRDALLPTMDDADLAAAEFVSEIEDELGPPEPVPAASFPLVANLLPRYQDEVLFERMTPAAAAEALMAEVDTVLG